MSEGPSRSLVAVGSLVRLSYGLGLLAAPDWMSARKLAASETRNAFGRMTTRAFGAVHVNVSLLTLQAVLQNRDERLALGLNLGCDFGDLMATLLEWRQGELPALAVGGSAVLQSGGMAIWSTALRSL